MSLEKYNDMKIGIGYSGLVIKEYAKSFYFAASFLPREKREGAHAVYNFCRHADNIVDKPRERSIDEIIGELNRLREELDLSYKYGESEHPSLMAFAHYAKKYSIPKEYAHDLLNGVEMDLTLKRYETFDELYTFCYRVASVVGLMMSYILGFKEDKALIHAEKMGIAMQLTNILRDVKEDKYMGRIYLPLAELRERKISEFNIINENSTPELIDYMKFNVDRAKKYYSEGDEGIHLLHKDARFAIHTASRIYGKILDIITERNYNPFDERAFVPKSQKFGILLNELLKTRFSQN